QSSTQRPRARPAAAPIAITIAGWIVPRYVNTAAIAANASCHREGVPVAPTLPIPVAASTPAVASATPRTSPATGVATSQRRAAAVIGTITRGGSGAAIIALAAPRAP